MSVQSVAHSDLGICRCFLFPCRQQKNYVSCSIVSTVHQTLGISTSLLHHYRLFILALLPANQLPLKKLQLPVLGALNAGISWYQQHHGLEFP